MKYYFMILFQSNFTRWYDLKETSHTWECWTSSLQVSFPSLNTIVQNRYLWYCACSYYGTYYLFVLTHTMALMGVWSQYVTTVDGWWTICNKRSYLPRSVDHSDEALLVAYEGKYLWMDLSVDRGKNWCVDINLTLDTLGSSSITWS